jgi:hypothetical protein
MEPSWPVVIKTFVTIVVGVPLILSFFGAPLLTRVRVAAAMAIGAVLLGFLAWPLVKPADVMGAVTLFAGDITILDALVCIILSFLSGLVAYFACFGHGLRIAPLAAPTGLAIWAFRSGDMTSLLRVNYTLAKRQALYATLRWEGFFWLIVVAAGYFGVLTAQTLSNLKPGPPQPAKSTNSKKNKALSIATAIVATIVITQFAIGILAQDVRMSDSQIGSVVGQPHVGQIAFAVLVSFGIAAYALKKFLDVNYIFPAMAAPALIFFATTFFAAKADVLEHMAQTWPVAFFSRAICAILPLQIVAFAAIGSIAGYRLAIKYTSWRKQAG